MCAQAHLRRRLPERCIIRLENSNGGRVEAVSSSVIQHRGMKHFSVFASFFWCYSHATSNTRKHLVVSRFSLAHDCRLPHPTPSQTFSSHEHIPQFRGLQFPARSCRCPQVERKRSVGIVFCLILWTQIFDQFRPLAAHLLVEV